MPHPSLFAARAAASDAVVWNPGLLDYVSALRQLPRCKILRVGALHSILTVTGGCWHRHVQLCEKSVALTCAMISPASCCFERPSSERGKDISCRVKAAPWSSWLQEKLSRPRVLPLWCMHRRSMIKRSNNPITSTRGPQCG